MENDTVLIEKYVGLQKELLCHFQC